MKIYIKSVNFTADQRLVDFIRRKMNKLDQFYDRIINGEVFLKVDNNHTKQNKIAEVRLNIPKRNLVVKKLCRSFEEATDLSIQALRRQLRRYKEKTKNMNS